MVKIGHTVSIMNTILSEDKLPAFQQGMETDKSDSMQRFTKARRAASFIFLMDGMGFGTWAALIPSFKAIFGLSDGTLAWVLFSMVSAALLAMPLTGKALHKWGSHQVISKLSVLYCIVLFTLMWVPNLQLFMLAAFVFGACKGVMDVAINAQAITVENAINKPIMSMFQAVWSLGGVCAAIIVSVALKAHVTPSFIGMGMACFLLVMGLLNGPSLLPDHAQEGSEGGAFSWRNPTLLKVGGLLFLVLFSEGAMMDWSAVYARSVSGAPSYLAPVAFAVFSSAMTTGRLVGDALLAKLGAIKVFGLGSLMLLMGVVLVSLWHVWPVTFLGFGIAGLGLSNMFPILLGVGARVHEHSSGPAVATVTTIGFFGFLVGPPVIGALSHSFGLPVALSSITLFALLLMTFDTRVISTLLIKQKD